MAGSRQYWVTDKISVLVYTDGYPPAIYLETDRRGDDGMPIKHRINAPDLDNMIIAFSKARRFIEGECPEALL